MLNVTKQLKHQITRSNKYHSLYKVELKLLQALKQILSTLKLKLEFSTKFCLFKQVLSCLASMAL